MIPVFENSEMNATTSSLTLAELRTILNVLESRGISGAEVLAHIDVSPEELCNPKARISLTQQLQALDYGIRNLSEPSLAFEIGQQMHLTTFGIVGFALLSSATLSDALELASRYGPLLNCKWTSALATDRTNASIYLIDNGPRSTFRAAECLTMEIAAILSLLRDLLGANFRPGLIRIPAYASSASGTLSFYGCPVEPNSARAEIVFDAGWLRRPLPQADSVTHASCVRACDHLLDEFRHPRNLLDEMKALLLSTDREIPSLPDVASVLCLSPRTLRRRLRDMNTSYLQVLNDVRRTLATQYLSTTAKTTEEIAELLGYSDAANFRHAFKRWTGQSPRQFRTESVATSLPPISPRQRTRQAASTRAINAGSDLARFWAESVSAIASELPRTLT